MLTLKYLKGDTMPSYWTDKTPRYRVVQAGIDRFFVIERDTDGREWAVAFFTDRAQAEVWLKEWDHNA